MSADVFPRLSPGAGVAWPADQDRNRRRRPRHSEARSVKLFDETSGGYFAGRTIDLSDTGLGLELPDRVPARVGETAYLAVSSGMGLVSRTSMLPVRYVWVRRVDKKLVCGVEILSAVGSNTARRAA